MSYKKQNFTDGNVLTAAELNHIEDGISAIDLDVQALKNQGTPEDGEDGVSPTVTVSKSGKVTTLTITDVNGTKTATINDGADGKTPVKGTDYFTEADKAEIVQAVIDSIGVPVYGFVDSSNNIVLTGELADGTYTLKYEYEDGTTAEIGTLTIGADTPTVIPITWNNGYKCSYTVGQSYAPVADSSYAISDVIEVEAGTTYTLNINSTVQSNLRVVGANDSGIVTELLIDNTVFPVGETTFTFTPTTETTQMRIRSYVDIGENATWVLTKE